jgi:hypothetical protein
MRKIPLFIILAVLFAFTQGCSIRQSLGYADNDLSWRQSFGDMKTEVSLGCSMANKFGDVAGIDPNTHIYYSNETGTVDVDVPLALGFYYRVFKNKVFDVSAGIKYTNNFKAVYKYTYEYRNNINTRHYHYDETLKLDLFTSNRVSLIFPDAEIKCPFSDNLKFTFSVELLYIGWRYNGGNYNYEFWQDVATNAAYTDGGNPGSAAAPGAINSVRGGSDIFSIGAINAGILYYF